MSPDELDEIMGDVREESKRAYVRYGNFASTHEAYGVLAEEVAELLDAIRSNDSESIDGEAIQVASVAIRLANAIRRHDWDFNNRSGFAEDPLD